MSTIVSQIFYIKGTIFENIYLDLCMLLYADKSSTLSILH